MATKLNKFLAYRLVLWF